MFMMNKYKIYKWKDIEHIFKNSSILLGNGASIAIDERFSYFSLKSTFDKISLFEDEKSLFKYFETNDFEQILKIIWQANNVNNILKVKDTKTEEVYKKIRDGLIIAVKRNHPEYNEISHNFPYISKFLENFKIIVSLNYDLIVYWAMLYHNENTYNKFVDCFIFGKYDESYLINRLENNKKVFYPHGNLILAFDKLLNEIKLNTNEDGLLASITKQWEEGEYVPLFVSEGTSKQKIDFIKKSNYLNSVYKRILPIMGGFLKYDFSLLQPSIPINYDYSVNRQMKYKTLVIYGFSFGKQDEHIIDKIFNNSLKIDCVAISVFNHNEEDCDKMINKLKKYNKYLHIYFFDSKSSGCWNNP